MVVPCKGPTRVPDENLSMTLLVKEDKDRIPTVGEADEPKPHCLVKDGGPKG
jgi:hypothetical protein